MLPIYCEYFGLTREPFNVTPDPGVFYASASHKEGLAQLVYGIRTRRGLLVLTGDVGTGKTTLIQSLLEEINDGHTRYALLPGLSGGPQGLLRSLCQEFGLITPGEMTKEISEYLTLLNRFLLDSYHHGDNVVIAIDEAQNLAADVLEHVRLLSNFETKQDKLVQILLVGQPELSDLLNDPKLRLVKQRIAVRHHLSSLDFSECKEYIARRLQISGGVASLFNDRAIQAIHDYSGGIPRLINILCDNGLLSAHALRRRSVEPGMIEQVAHDLQLAAPRRRPLGKRKSVIGKPREMSVRGSVTAGDFTPRADLEEQEAVNAKFVVKTTPQAAPVAIAAREPPANGEKPETEPGETHTDQPGFACVPERLFQAMIGALTEATGPMAEVIVRDHVAAMGESRSAFPMRRLQQLLDQTSSEIANDSLRERYRRKMCEELFAFNAALAEN
jgi:type II secretory pathway predicted ATPase ExeA